jgi:talin
MPRSYQKSKADRRFLDEWNSQRDSNELNAKVKYIQLARSLKTYGVTFFLVQEKMKGRNKLVPRLFGVTRNSCMRLDEKTKEVRLCKRYRFIIMQN